MQTTSSTTSDARGQSAPGAGVVRDSAWVLLGVLLGTFTCHEVLPGLMTMGTGEAVSAASIATFTMLLASLRDASHQ